MTQTFQFPTWSLTSVHIFKCSLGSDELNSSDLVMFYATSMMGVIATMMVGRLSVYPDVKVSVSQVNDDDEGLALFEASGPWIVLLSVPVMAVVIGPSLGVV